MQEQEQKTQQEQKMQQEQKTQQDQQPEQAFYKEVPQEQTNKIIRQHVWSAMGVGLIPIPIVDVAGLTGIQLNLLRKLAQAYEVPFFKEIAKNLISSLVGSALPVAMGLELISLIKFIPVVGQSFGSVTMPLMGGAATYALGKVFVQHFASGGTFLTFNPEKVKAYYEQMLREGQKISAGMKKNSAGDAAQAQDPSDNA